MNDGQSLLIIGLSGHFCIEHIDKIQDITRQIKLLSQVRYVVIDMSETADVESNMNFSLAKIQKEIREMGLHLRVCSLQSKLKKKLVERGIIRENELFENLSLAVKSLLARQKIDQKMKNGRGDPIAA